MSSPSRSRAAAASWKKHEMPRMSILRLLSRKILWIIFQVEPVQPALAGLELKRIAKNFHPHSEWRENHEIEKRKNKSRLEVAYFVRDRLPTLPQGVQRLRDLHSTVTLLAKFLG